MLWMITAGMAPRFIPLAAGSASGRRRPGLRAWRVFVAAVVRSLSGLPALLLVGGCATITVPTPPPPDPPGRFVALTRPVIVLGDSQEHESTGFPMHDNDGAVDEYVEVAQRPPEQPLFGRRVLEWALLSHPEEPVIHMGDLLDVSCESELDRMRKVFQVAKQPHVILPGNHDGLLFGIFNYDVFDNLFSGRTSDWDRACRRGRGEGSAVVEPRSGAALTKRGYIVAYLNSLAGGPHSRIPGLPMPKSSETTYSWRNADPAGFIEAVEAKILSDRSFARSFVAQKLRLPSATGAPRRVTIIGLDTNQITAFISTLDTVRGISPGHFGHVLADQIAAVSPWLEQARRAGDIVVFAGHHNWNQLSLDTQARVGALMLGVDSPLVYLSAHTHRGYWASHRILSRSMLELNVNSLSDWPISYRRVSFSWDEAAKRLQVSADILPNLGSPPRDDEDLLRAWKEEACAQSGLTASEIESQELAVVRQQRESRGTLMDWLYQGLGESCPSCLQGLYESGGRYQDALLETIHELYQDVGSQIPALHAVQRPARCEGRSVPACMAMLRATHPTDLDATIALVRAKAAFVDTVNGELDLLQAPQLRAYMTCRAVLAAKIDHDLTPGGRRAGSDEASRRAQDFFRVEATVGMQ
jgi:hypothetical protein